GTRPTRPKAWRSASVYAVALLSTGSCSRSMPRLPPTDAASAGRLFISGVVAAVSRFSPAKVAFAMNRSPRGQQDFQVRMSHSICCNVGLSHLAGIDDAIKLGCADRAEFQRGILERQVMV